MTLRVLHAPCLAAGNPGRLARAEREIGLGSWCISSDPNPYGYPVDEQARTIEHGRLGFEAQRWALLGRALRNFDVVHFNFGRTLFPNAAQLDLPLLRRAGKAIFMTFQGDDARQGDYCRKNFAVSFAARVDAAYYGDDDAKRARIARVDRYAHGIFALNPDLLHVLPARARFLPYANVDLDAWRPLPMPRNPVPVVVHAPTHRAVKGSDLVLAAAERLKAEGERFELVLVENMTHAEARSAYERADLAVDQLFAGWYGGFAVEMMALGRPVLSYIREGDLRYLPEGMAEDMPVIPVTPDGIRETLRDWIRAPHERRAEVGRLGRSYVEKWHDPRAVAARLRVEYEAATGRRGDG
jgi:glycosyltransferase involved in cell wall biosynthesis